MQLCQLMKSKRNDEWVEIMKKHIVIILLVLVLIVLGALILWRYQSRIPGGLVDPKTLPKADHSDVGTAVTVSMNTLLAEQPGDMKTLTFAYVYNGTHQKGRLAVFTHYEDEKPVSMLTIYETDWTDIGNFLFAIEEGFQAEIVDRAIVSSEEERRLWMASYHVSDNLQLKEAEIVSSDTPMTSDDGMYYYFGHISNQRNDPKCLETKTGNYLMIVGYAESDCGESIATAIKNLKLTAKRFGLEASLGM